MKKFFAKIKHIVKDPITTIAEADARKKEILPLLYVCIGIAVVPSVLGSLIPVLGFLMIFGVIGIFGCMFCGFLLFIIHKAKEKFKAFTCDNCKTMLDIHTAEEYAELVSYEILSSTTDFKLSHPESKDGVVSNITARGTATVLMNVTFRCPQCGEFKSFKYQINPFSCEQEEKKVLVRDVELVKTRLETSVKAVLATYASEDPDNNKTIPYTIQSIYHPNYENREKLQLGSTTYNGVTIKYHRGVAEMVEGLFIRNELNGKIINPKEKKAEPKAE